MKQLAKYNVILWDFDGVILDSMAIRDLGFEKTLSNFPKTEVAQLMEFHRKNGGLSRYVKFRYFFEEIRNEEISEEEVLEYAQKFSAIMMDLLIDEKLLIEDSVSFIKEAYTQFKFHIVSGSDGVELNNICKELELSSYFLSIEGSPIPKNKLVKDILELYKYKKGNVCLIGDSINDLEAAEANGIYFFGYNNESLKKLNSNYIESFKL